MENKKPNTISLIITGVALIAIIALLVIAKKQQQQNLTATQPTPTTTTASLCYLLNKPALSGTGNDVGYLKITTSDGGKTVTGELGTRPAEKDAVSGTLAGEISNDNGVAVFDGQYDNKGEGMETVQEQLIRLDETQAQIGFGEMKKDPEESVTYYYKDTNAVTYSYTLPAVDCAQYDTLRNQIWK